MWQPLLVQKLHPVRLGEADEIGYDTGHQEHVPWQHLCLLPHGGHADPPPNLLAGQATNQSVSQGDGGVGCIYRRQMDF